MFLFLSKLLPLFIYPLGLTCLLLLVALIALWKRPRIAAGAIVAAFLLLILSSNSWVAGQLLKSLEWQNLPGELPKADAIVVLGGCTRPPVAPRAGVEVTEAGDRILYAATLYRQGKAPYVIFSGGRISWYDGGSAESADMAEIAQQLGVPPSAILQDPTSLNTRENAVNVKQILDSKGWKRVLLVTTATHMPRSVRIFKRLGIDAIPAPTDFITTRQPISDSPNSTWEGTLLNTLPDVERLEDTTRVIKEYFGMVIYWLRGWI